MDEVELCNRLAFFYNGTIKAIGSPRELLSKYPFRIFSVQANHLRSFLGTIQQLFGLDAYLCGDQLKITLADDDIKLITEKLLYIGLKDYVIKEVQPSLEDLFSILSHEGY